MPVNATQEYFLAEKKYLEARTIEDRIKCLQEMISALPKHKSSEHQLSELRHRLAKLKREAAASKKASAKPKFVIPKEGAARVCIIGLTQSGKSILLNALTNADVEIGDHPFTTQLPQVGMMFVDHVQIQLIEIPSTFEPEAVDLLHNCDEMIVLIDNSRDVRSQKTEMIRLMKKNRLLGKKYVFVTNNYTQKGLEKLKRSIWKSLGLIKIYTKEPGKEKDLPPIVMKPGSTVADVAKEVHKDFLKNFQFARVFNGTRFSGQKVGLDYTLRDEDVVEIHAR